MLKDQFESYEGQSCDIISTKKQLEVGGEMDLTDDKRLRVRKPVMPKRKMSEQEWAEKHNPRAYEYMTKRKMATGGGVKKGDVGKSGTQYGYTLKEWEEMAEKKGLLVSPSQWWKSQEGTKYKDSFGRTITIGNREQDKRQEMESYGYRIAIGLDLGSKKIPLSAKNYVQENNFSKYETGGALIGNQSRIDMNKNGKIDAEDFKLLRSSMNGAWRNERKHVNHNEDYEVRYSKPRPKRTGYKGKRNFEVGGKMDMMKKAESGTMVKKGVKGGIMTLAKKIRKEGESWQDAVKRAGQQLK